MDGISILSLVSKIDLKWLTQFDIFILFGEILLEEFGAILSSRESKEEISKTKIIVFFK